MTRAGVYTMKLKLPLNKRHIVRASRLAALLITFFFFFFF